MTASGSTFTSWGHLEVNELSPLPLPPLSFHQIWTRVLSQQRVTCLEAVQDRDSKVSMCLLFPLKVPVGLVGEAPSLRLEVQGSSVQVLMLGVVL